MAQMFQEHSIRKLTAISRAAERPASKCPTYDENETLVASGNDDGQCFAESFRRVARRSGVRTYFRLSELNS